MNVYAQVILDEARRRGIRVAMIDEERSLFRLEHRGVSIRCHESLTDRTSAVVYEICADKRLSAQLLREAGFRVPRQATGSIEEARRFLEEAETVVVKPAVGEQGRGITVGVSEAEDLEAAIEAARGWASEVLVEEFVEGRDLRIIVIDDRFVAAIERIPATVLGDGRSSVADLVRRRNEELDAETGGESRIPEDGETRRWAALGGRGWDEVVPAGEALRVRGAANYHTGGRIVDVTEEVSPTIRRAAEGAARALGVPVVGLDLLVPDFAGSDYVIVEANERPGLANHEPQPVPQRFIDYLFPETAGQG